MRIAHKKVPVEYTTQNSYFCDCHNTKFFSSNACQEHEFRHKQQVCPHSDTKWAIGADTVYKCCGNCHWVGEEYDLSPVHEDQELCRMIVDFIQKRSNV